MSGGGVPKPEKKTDKPDEKPQAVKPVESKAVLPKSQPRGRVYDSILQTIGGTPMVRLPRFTAHHNLEADILAKLEFFNPLSSVKDRTALAMFEDAEQAGKIKPGKSVLVEPTSGGTGIALAYIAAAKGYRLILTMPENVSFDRRKILLLLGAELILTPADTGMRGAVERAKSVVNMGGDDHFMFSQFDSLVNVQMHSATTAEEIWADTEGKIDIIVAGVGTGATIAGIAKILRERKPGFKAYAVEPAESAVLSGMEEVKQHQIQGIGAGFIPAILDVKLLDGVITIASNRAFEVAREVAKLDGIPCGISSGAALAAAIDVARVPESKGKMIGVIMPSSAERYFATELFQKF